MLGGSPGGGVVTEPVETLAKGAGGIADSVIGGVADAASKGLSQAVEAAGDVLHGIFGALPWEMTASNIVDAVSPGLLDASAVMVDVVGVISG